MSTRKRIARATVVALTVLGIGSIGMAGVFATHSFGPTPAIASSRVAQQGVLGVGEQTSGPMIDPVLADEKVDLGPEPIAIAALTAPAAKAATRVPPAVPTRQAKRKSVRSRGSALLAKLGKGWRRARVSWYGPGFYGNTMAGGGKLTRTSMVVAHRSMPFGTKIQFTYRGRSCTAVVRDRGPYISGRVFDLGPGTAKALGFSGVGTVSYRILGR